MQTPETDMAGALESALQLTTDQVKCGPPRSPTEPGSDQVVIWVAPYSEDAAPLLDAANQGSMWTTRVQVTVLGNADDYAGAITRARQVRDALHTKQTASYIAWVLTPGFGGPNYLGVNEAGQHHFTVNVTATWKATN